MIKFRYKFTGNFSNWIDTKSFENIDCVLDSYHTVEYKVLEKLTHRLKVKIITVNYAEEVEFWDDTFPYEDENAIPDWLK